MKNVKLMLFSMKRIVLFFIFMSFGLFAAAQEVVEVNGTVKDESGGGVIGASVREKGR